jgi:hypothetical protein
MAADIMAQGVRRRARGARPIAAPAPALDLRLPELPQSAQERADLLQAVGATLVCWCGPVTGLALAASIDEAAAEVAGDAERR